MAITYRHAGVDAEAGDALVDRIAPLAKATRIAEVLEDVGGFAGMCAVPSGIEDPILVSGTDGVGTKLKVAFAMNKHDTIGIDLVAMSVNDVITTGARPLFFLDYFATGHLEVGIAESVIAGVARGCKESGCALIGGETAELPGMYAPGEYDLAGFCVGVVSRKKIIDGKRVQAGDAIIGLRSSGLHSNGFSLARRVLTDFAEKPTVLGGASVGDALLTPTRLYARLIEQLKTKVDLLGMSHITGSGIPGNLPRVLPEGLGAALHASALPRGPLFSLIQERGPVDEAEMRHAFNLGIGFVLIVAQREKEAALEALRGLSESPIDLGVVIQKGDVPYEDRVEIT